MTTDNNEVNKSAEENSDRELQEIIQHILKSSDTIREQNPGLTNFKYMLNILPAKPKVDPD